MKNVELNNEELKMIRIALGIYQNKQVEKVSEEIKELDNPFINGPEEELFHKICRLYDKISELEEE